jgi:hypothetical protein
VPLTDFGFAKDTHTPSWISKENWNNILFVSIMSVQLKNFVVTLMDNEKEWRSWFESHDGENMPQLNLDLDASGANGK